MPVWKLTTNLMRNEVRDWDLISKLTLGENVHTDRKKSFILARKALRECLKDLQIQSSPDDLFLDPHYQLVNFPQLSISLSHTKEAGAAIVASKTNFKSVGIDIEHEARVVKEVIRERISHPQDEDLRNIELWCLKEAVFKALMNSGAFENPVEFSSLRIGNKKWSHTPSGHEGEWDLDVVNSLLVARAYLRN